MRTLLSLVSLCGVVWSCTYCTRTKLNSLIVTNYGNWQNMEYCPAGTYANGLQVKYQWDVGKGDNTALNGARLFCNRLDTCSASNPISSGVGPWGSWQSVQYCPTGQSVIGFALLSWTWKNGADNRGVVNFAAYCGEPFGSRTVAKWLQGNTNPWGQWRGNHFCPDGYLVCGIQTQVDSSRFKGADYHAVTNANLDCCKITDIPCTPSYQLVHLASFDNTNGRKVLTTSYSVKSSYTKGYKTPSRAEMDVINGKISSSAYTLIAGINAAAGSSGSDPLTAATLNSLVHSAIYGGERPLSVQVPKKTRANIKQLYLTCGEYRIGVSHAFEEGTRKPGQPHHSHEDDDSGGDSEDDC